jgi:hypothetical protein
MYGLSVLESSLQLNFSEIFKRCQFEVNTAHGLYQ